MINIVSLVFIRRWANMLIKLNISFKQDDLYNLTSSDVGLLLLPATCCCYCLCRLISSSAFPASTVPLPYYCASLYVKGSSKSMYVYVHKTYCMCPKIWIKAWISSLKLSFTAQPHISWWDMIDRKAYSSYPQYKYTPCSKIDWVNYSIHFTQVRVQDSFFCLIKCSICRTPQLLWPWTFISGEGTACSHLDIYTLGYDTLPKWKIMTKFK